MRNKQLFMKLYEKRSFFTNWKFPITMNTFPFRSNTSISYEHFSISYENFSISYENFSIVSALLSVYLQDALKARRNQEAAEREWRRKEMEEAVKKKETEDMLKKSREEQLKYKELSMAVEVAKNEAEFNRVLRYTLLPILLLTSHPLLSLSLSLQKFKLKLTMPIMNM